MKSHIIPRKPPFPHLWAIHCDECESRERCERDKYCNGCFGGSPVKHVREALKEKEKEIANTGN